MLPKHSASFDKFRPVYKSPAKSTSDAPLSALRAGAEAVRGLLASFPLSPNRALGYDTLPSAAKKTDALYDVPAAAQLQAKEEVDTTVYEAMAPGGVLLNAPTKVTPDDDSAPMAPVGQLRPASELQARQTVDTDEYAPMAPIARPVVDSGDDEVMARGEALRNAPAKVTPVDDDYAPMAPVGQLIASEPLTQEAVDAVVYEAMAPGGALRNAPTKSTPDDDYAPMAPVGQLGPAPIRERLKAITSRKDLQAVAPSKRLQVANDYEVMAPCKQKIFAKVTPVDDDYAPMAPVGQLIASEPQTQEAVEAGVYEAMAPGGMTRPKPIYENAEAMDTIYVNVEEPRRPPERPPKPLPPLPPAVAPKRLQVADDYEVMAPSKLKIFDQKAPADDYEVMAPRKKRSEVLSVSSRKKPAEVAADYETMGPGKQLAASQGDYEVMSSAGVPKKQPQKREPVTPPRPPKPPCIVACPGHGRVRGDVQAGANI